MGGGLILLMFAVIVESTLGYHGYLGEVALGNTDRWDMILWRGWHMETTHTIALCIIVNGIVMGLLSRKGGHLKWKRNIRIFAVLAVITVALTGPVWWVLKRMVPGYPLARLTSDIAGRYLEVQ